jgi:hypothetical protein
MEADAVSELVSPVPRDAWEALTLASSDALAFHAPGWIDAICATGAWRDATLFFRTASGGCVVVPMVERARLPARVARRASLPYGWGFGGVVGSAEVAPDEFRAVVAHLAQNRSRSTTVRPSPLLRDSWAAAVAPGVPTRPRTAHVLDLGGGFERVFEERFKSRARTAIRRAESSGVLVERDMTGRLVPDFYALYEKSLVRWAARRRMPVALARRLGRARDPHQKFTEVAARLGEACRIWVARVEGRPAAALICLVRGGAASYWRGCIDDELASQSRASYLLQRAAIEDACAAGCLHYHMGETAESSGLAQFKEAFGAQLHRYDEFHFRPVRRGLLQHEANGAVGPSADESTPRGDT